MSQYNVANNGNSSPNVEFLVGNTGGPIGPNSSFQIDLLGAGSVNVAGNPGTNTLTISVSGSGLTWNVITATSANLSPNNGYFTTNSSTTTLNMPATSAVGDYISIVGNGTGQWVIQCQGGQQVRIGDLICSAGGTWTSNTGYDAIDLVCAVANTLWISDGGPQSGGLSKT